MRLISIVFSILLAPVAALADSAGHQHGGAHASPYAGEETRAIKSLSSEDITELRRGGGWGLAKAAELNGMPGPAHVLQLREKLMLDQNQIAAVTAIYNRMNREARRLGAELIAAEAALDQRFRSGSIADDHLRKMLQGIAEIRAGLRFVHLSAHLELRPVLTAAQVDSYNRLRGYTPS